MFSKILQAYLSKLKTLADMTKLAKSDILFIIIIIKTTSEMYVALMTLILFAYFADSGEHFSNLQMSTKE